ncbi:MAG: DUF2934 domain-containing protein [Acidobacteriaceae bacterium]|nr:DUF2934 domain-containing protein [Acidobacteriaceae bacterium]
MTDPKLNEIPVEPRGAAERPRSGQGQPPRKGLSINDTIAADANLSVGGHGVDTSGVVSGAGAGAGSTALNPGDSGSPAPRVVPGAASSGTTPRGDSGLSASPNPGADLQRESTTGPTDDEIAARAHGHWIARGRPHGSPEVDWNSARQELIEERRQQAMSTIAASA